MTGAQERALEALIDAVCTSESADVLAAAWGAVEPSDQRPGGLRVVCGPDGPFEAVEVRPWSSEVTGVVEPKLRRGETPLSWASVRERFGPFRELPRLHGGTAEYGAIWTVAGAAADVFLIVGVKNEAVVAITIRRDPR